jgi:hypothetical protein
MGHQRGVMQPRSSVSRFGREFKDGHATFNVTNNVPLEMGHPGVQLVFPRGFWEAEWDGEIPAPSLVALLPC